MGYVIRKMEQVHIKQVQDVAKTTWNATYDGIIPLEVQENFLKSAYSEESMKRRLQHSNLFVAEVEEVVVGFANFSSVREDGKVELGAIYIYPKYHGKGIGSALLLEGMNKLDGVREIYINVQKDNQVGKNFYEAKGFQYVKEFADTIGGLNIETVRMVLKVNKLQTTT